VKDTLIRAVSSDGAFRAAAADTTQLTEELRRLQGADPTATVALGRVAAGAALMGSLLKEDQRLSLVLEGNGPLQKLLAETDAAGHLRASVKNPVTGLPMTEGRFPVAEAIGRAGFLHVTKDLGLKDPYRSMIQLRTSEVAEDLAYYFTVSEQVPSSVALGVFLAADGSVAAAGGYLVQALPGSDSAAVDDLETRLRGFPPPTKLLRDGLGPQQILDRLFREIPLKILGSVPLVLRCSCSRRQIAHVLQALGAKELGELKTQAEPTVVTCEFCRRTYSFSPDEIARLIPILFH